MIWPAASASGPRTAFVLSGGASLGALQVGMLEALYELGITADFLVGSSVGALNAAFVASRPQSPQTARELGRVWRDLQREDVFPVSMSALVGGVCGRRDHLVPDRDRRKDPRNRRGRCDRVHRRTFGEEQLTSLDEVESEQMERNRRIGEVPKLDVPADQPP